MYILSRRVSLGLSLSSTALALVGCAGAPKPVISTINVTVLAGTDLNPDARRRASPVTIRLYAMKSAAIFESADFFSLFDKDTATLGGELVQREEMLLRPGEQKVLPLKVGGEVKALAVMAAFRDLERSRWRDVHMVDIGKATNLVVKLNGSSIALEASPAAK